MKKYASSLAASLIISGCNNLLIENPLEANYDEFLGHHYIEECEDGNLSGYYLEGFETYSISTFNATFDNCDDLNIISIDYEYLYDFSVDADGAPIAEGIERITYEPSIITEHLGRIFMREYGFYSNEVPYRFIDI